MSKLSPVK